MTLSVGSVEADQILGVTPAQAGAILRSLHLQYRLKHLGMDAGLRRHDIAGPVSPPSTSFAGRPPPCAGEDEAGRPHARPQRRFVLAQHRLEVVFEQQAGLFLERQRIGGFGGQRQAEEGDQALGRVVRGEAVFALLEPLQQGLFRGDHLFGDAQPRCSSTCRA